MVRRSILNRSAPVESAILSEINPVARKRGLLMRISRIVRGIAPLALLISLASLLAVSKPSLLSVNALNVLAEESSVILFLATAQTVVILLGSIDVSMAAVGSLASVLIALALPTIGSASVIVVLALTALIGAAQGMLHTRARIPSFIVTLAGLGVWSGLALIVAHTTIPIQGAYSAITCLARSDLGLPNSFSLALVFLAVVALSMRVLPFGRKIYAIGLAEQAALFSGIRVKRVKVLVFALAGLFSGIAGWVMTARTSSGSPTMVNSLLLPSIAAVLVGGTAITGGVGGLGRTLIGALTITILRVSFTAIGLNPAYEPITYGLVLIAAVAATTGRSRLHIVK